MSVFSFGMSFPSTPVTTGGVIPPLPSSNFRLLEDGFYRLLEDGSKRLLE